jgi:D-xylonolactonase
MIIRRSRPGALLGEGPLWSERDNTLYWVDILGHKLHGAGQSWSFPEPICWVIEREKGGFICGLMSGFAELSLSPFSVKPIGNPYPGEPENRMNDAKADDKGRIWAGSMHKPIAKTSGALYRLDPDFSWREMDGPYRIANGPAFSPDFRTLYHTDSASGEVFRFDLSADGKISNKGLFVKFPEEWGSPDGMTTDQSGGVWIAQWGAGRIGRFTPDGKLDFTIALPARQISSACFGGPDLDRLFVTSAAVDLDDDPEAGTLFEVPAALLRGHRGMPAQRFKG